MATLVCPNTYLCSYHKAIISIMDLQIVYVESFIVAECCIAIISRNFFRSYLLFVWIFCKMSSPYTLYLFYIIYCVFIYLFFFFSDMCQHFSQICILLFQFQIWLMPHKNFVQFLNSVFYFNAFNCHFTPAVWCPFGSHFALPAWCPFQSHFAPMA